jgi:hypothetical protein
MKAREKVLKLLSRPRYIIDDLENIVKFLSHTVRDN